MKVSEFTNCCQLNIVHDLNSGFDGDYDIVNVQIGYETDEFDEVDDIEVTAFDDPRVRELEVLTELNVEGDGAYTLAAVSADENHATVLPFLTKLGFHVLKKFTGNNGHVLTLLGMDTSDGYLEDRIEGLRRAIGKKAVAEWKKSHKKYKVLDVTVE